MMESKTFRLPESKCPCCYHKLDAATGVKAEGKPQKGDLTVCINCAAMLMWNERMELERLTPAECLEIRKKDPAAWAALRATQVTILLARIEQRESKAARARWN